MRPERLLFGVKPSGWIFFSMAKIYGKNDKNEIKKQVRGRLHLEVPKFFKNDNYA